MERPVSICWSFSLEGAAAVEPERLTIVHHRPGVFESSLRIYLAAPHGLARAHLLYHYQNIFLADSSTG